MIFVIGLCLALAGKCARFFLMSAGRFDWQSRWTDWLFVLPFWGGAACMLYSVCALAARFLP